MSITEVNEATRDAWVAETVSQTRERLEAFGTGDGPFSEEATEGYGKDMAQPKQQFPPSPGEYCLSGVPFSISVVEFALIQGVNDF